MYKRQYISGLIVSAVILLMAFELLKSSVEKILHPQAVDFSLLSLGILAVSILVKLCLLYTSCEMIAEVLQYFDEDIKLSTREADSIYAGILIDTNNFMTKTGVRTFEAAAYLLSLIHILFCIRSASHCLVGCCSFLTGSLW